MANQIKKYKIQQKTQDGDILTLHPETEATITLIDPFLDINGPTTQKALEQLNAKINIAQSSILYNTKAGWDAQPSLRAEKNIVYVYTDAFTYNDGEQDITVAGIKIGDGNAYLYDLGFISDKLAYEIAALMTQFQEHLADNVSHITAEERAKWNNKLNYEVLDLSEMLVFNRN